MGLASNAFISDGYGNRRVVKLDKAGTFRHDVGHPRTVPSVPFAASIAVDAKDRVYVSDRENNRIQIFYAGGKLLRFGSTLMHAGHYISPKERDVDITHRTTANITYDTLAGS